MARLTVGGIAGILLLVALTVLLAASIRRIIVSYRNQRKVDVIAVAGLVVVLLVFVCFCLTLLGPTIGERFDLIALPD